MDASLAVSAAEPRVGARTRHRLGRVGVYAFLTVGAIVVLLP